jgi:hypothetical protein
VPRRHDQRIQFFRFLRAEVSAKEDELVGPVEFLVKLKLHCGAAKSTVPSIFASVSGITFAPPASHKRPDELAAGSFIYGFWKTIGGVNPGKATQTCGA